ncbi:ferritin-like domain-containing protein [Actinomadura litoris]|uniref:ferritin-like domain-containing protein n=1 Tax=Actinomadura litoris TaxID=2678616 RepID=UPI001FA7713E|nr:ferritin-like protein [Actinomadura litoris]
MTTTTTRTKARKPASKTKAEAKAGTKAKTKAKTKARAARKAEDRLVRTRPIRRLDPAAGIRTVGDLADHLYVAAQVELSTIPMYLFSAYSIRTRGHSQWAAPRGVLRTLVGISIEEMLHLALVRNLMVAIGYGDDISFYDEEFIPSYPSTMLNRYNPDDPDGAEIILSLDRLSKEHVGTFRRVEMPDDIDLGAETFARHPRDIGQYTSLGEFYRAIEQGFIDLEDEIEWAVEDARKQYKRGFWNEFGNGKPIRVHNLATARQALRIIIEQGEGTITDHKKIEVRPGVEDYTHYEKFVRVQEGIEGIGAVDGGPEHRIDIDDPEATWPVVADPLVADFDDQPGVQSLMTLFNAAYCYTLCLLDETYAHSTDDVKTKKVPGTDREEMFSHRYRLERNDVAVMQGILYPIAQALVTTPIPDGPYKGRHAAPSFEFYDFDADEQERTKKEQLVDLCAEAIEHFPVLGGPDGVERQIRLLVDI